MEDKSVVREGMVCDVLPGSIEDDIRRLSRPSFRMLHDLFNVEHPKINVGLWTLSYTHGADSYYSVGVDDWLPLPLIIGLIGTDDRIVREALHRAMNLDPHSDTYISWSEVNFPLVRSMLSKFCLQDTVMHEDSMEASYDEESAKRHVLMPLRDLQMLFMHTYNSALPAPLHHRPLSEAYVDTVSSPPLSDLRHMAREALLQVFQMTVDWLAHRGFSYDPAKQLVHAPGYKAMVVVGLPAEVIA